MDHMKTGGPAFGTVVSLDCVRVEMDGSMEYEPTVEPGNLTMRDYFAAKAMQGELAAQSEESGFYPDENFPALAKRSYAVADAMLNERAK